MAKKAKTTVKSDPAPEVTRKAKPKEDDGDGSGLNPFRVVFKSGKYSVLQGMSRKHITERCVAEYPEEFVDSINRI